MRNVAGENTSNGGKIPATAEGWKDSGNGSNGGNTPVTTGRRCWCFHQQQKWRCYFFFRQPLNQPKDLKIYF